MRLNGWWIAGQTSNDIYAYAYANAHIHSQKNHKLQRQLMRKKSNVYKSTVMIALSHLRLFSILLKEKSYGTHTQTQNVKRTQGGGKTKERMWYASILLQNKASILFVTFRCVYNVKFEYKWCQSSLLLYFNPLFPVLWMCFWFERRVSANKHALSHLIFIV